MTPKRRQWRRPGVFIVNFEHVIAGWIVVKNYAKADIIVFWSCLIDCFTR